MKLIYLVYSLILFLNTTIAISANVVPDFYVGASGTSEFMSHTSYANKIESNVQATSNMGEENAVGNKYFEHSFVDWGVFASGASELLVHAKQIISPERIVLSSYSEASLFMHTTNNLGGNVHVYGLISGQISFLDQSQNFSILAVRSLSCEGLCIGFEPEHSRQYLEGYGNEATIYTGNNSGRGMFIEGQDLNQDGLLRMRQEVEVTINYGSGATQNNPIQASSTTNISTTTQLSTIFSGSAATGDGVTFANTAASQFGNVGSGSWFDPLSAIGFLYEMNSDSLFTEIINFPTGFEGEFTVWAEGSNLGNYQNGDYLSFLELLGHGVSRFAITGIDPEGQVELVDFPIQLAFDTPTASFTQYALEGGSTPAVPEPETYALMLAGLGLVVFQLRRNQPHNSIEG